MEKQKRKKEPEKGSQGRRRFAWQEERTDPKKLGAFIPFCLVLLLAALSAYLGIFGFVGTALITLLIVLIIRGARLGG